MERDLLGADLERLFDLAELMQLGRWVLGVEPDEVGGQGARGSFAAALAKRCAAEDATAALCDAVLALRQGTDPSIARLRDGREEGGFLEAGDKLGPYTIERGLGQGALGSVYAARRGGDAARIKLLHRHCARDRSALQRFLALNRRLEARGHVGLPTRFESLTFDGRIALVQAYVEGETLDTRLPRTGPARPRELWAVLRGTLEALASLHDRRIVHGDLALSNVLVAPDGDSERVLLLDAGSDFLRAQLPPAAARRSAPELLHGETPTPRSDVYAFGALLYQLMSGRPVFPRSNGQEAWLLPLTHDADPLSFHAPRGFVTGELDEFVMGLLDRDPSHRPADAGVALEILEALVELSVRRDSLLPEAELDHRAQALLEAPDDEVRAATLEAAVDQGADPRRIGDALRMAADALEQRPEALEARRRLLYRAAALFERSAADLDAAERTYQTLLSLDPADEIASAHLERIYRRLGKHDRLVETLLARAEQSPGARERAAAFARMGNLLAVELDDAEQALIAYTHALCADPTESDFAEQIERLAGADGQAWTDVLTSCSETVADDATAEQRSQLLGYMGRWYASRLKRPDLAVQCYQTVLEADPANDLALREMASLYREARLWRELVGVLVLRADAAVTPSLGRELRAEAAEICVEQLDDTAAAKRLYEQVLSEDPAHAHATRGLAELVRREGDLPACIAILERRAAALRSDARRELLLEIAGIEEHALADAEAAARRYGNVLVESPEDLDALSGLERIYVRLGRYPELVDNLHRQLALAVVPGQKTLLLERIAAIYAEEFLDRAMATDTLEKALELDPNRESTLQTLAEHYRALERWQDLIRVLERQLEHKLARAARIEKLTTLAEVYGDRLDQPEPALARWDAVLELDPGNDVALGQVARLRATLGDQEHALVAIETMAAKAAAPDEKARHFAEAARLLEERGEIAAAIERYKRALEATPRDAALLDRLSAAHLAQGDTAAAMSVLERRIEHADSDWVRARVCAELAKLARDRLDDAELASTTARRAIGYDPDNTAALALLADMAYEADDFEQAANLYRKAGGQRADPAVLARHADALSKLGRNEEALAVAERWLALAPDDLDAVRRGARLAFQCGAWKRAAELALTWHDRVDSRDQFADRGEALYVLGESRRQLGDGDGAREALQRAARLLPDDARPLAAVAHIHEEREEWHELERTLERNLDRVEPDSRLGLYMKLGEIASRRLGDADAAARRYLAALAEHPKERRVLLKLLELYSAGKDWTRLVDVILEIAELVSDDEQQARYLHAAARVAAQELDDKQRAVELLERALALDPALPDAASEAVELHQSLGDVDAAVRVLELQLRAVSRDGDRKQALAILDQLADLHLSQLRVEDAITATEAAYQLAPESERRGKLLAELYASEPTRYASQAVHAQQELLREDPYRPEPYETLHALYSEASQPDGVWCVCQALVLLHRATPRQEAFFRLHRRPGPLATSAHVTDDEWWALLMHPGADPQVTGVFRLIQPSMVTARTKAFEKFGYRFDQRVDTGSDAQGLALALGNAANVLGMSLPPIVHDASLGGAISLLRSNPGAIALGDAGMSKDLPARQAAFVAAAHLSYFRPGLYARYLIPTRAALKAWLLAAIKLIAPRLPIAADLEGPTEEAHRILAQEMVGPARDQLAEPVSELLRRGAMVDLARWVNAIDLTADRAGLLLSDDLASALALVKSSRDEATSVPIAERLKHLYRYSVSSEYLSLRAHLRVDVGRGPLES